MNLQVGLISLISEFKIYVSINSQNIGLLSFIYLLAFRSIIYYSFQGLEDYRKK